MARLYQSGLHTRSNRSRDAGRFSCFGRSGGARGDKSPDNGARLAALPVTIGILRHFLTVLRSAGLVSGPLCVANDACLWFCFHNTARVAKGQTDEGVHDHAIPVDVARALVPAVMGSRVGASCLCYALGAMSDATAGWTGCSGRAEPTNRIEYCTFPIIRIPTYETSEGGHLYWLGSNRPLKYLQRKSAR